MHDQILDMLIKEDEITWKTILMDLIRSEEMDPWDVDLSVLSNRYIETIKKLQEANLGVSGKVLLASAILLKIKTDRLVEEDLLNLDRMIRGEEDDDFEDGEFDEDDRRSLIPVKMPKHYLLPRVPQPRKRKVSIYDLIDALQKALKVTKRRAVREILENVEVNAPTKKVDIEQLIKDVYKKVLVHYGTEDEEQPTPSEDATTLKFSQLIPSEEKEDVVLTLLPLLQLSNDRKLNLDQEQHFDDFDVTLTDKESIGVDIEGDYEHEQKQFEKKKKKKAKKSSKKAKSNKKKEEEEQAEETQEEETTEESSQEKKESEEEEPFITNTTDDAPLLDNAPNSEEGEEEQMIVSEVYEAAKTTEEKEEESKDKKEDEEHPDYIG